MGPHLSEGSNEVRSSWHFADLHELLFSFMSRLCNLIRMLRFDVFPFECTLDIIKLLNITCILSLEITVPLNQPR